jgi:hypothetical protein
MEPKKLDKLLCQMIVQTASLFDPHAALAEENVVDLSPAQTARILDKVRARIAAAEVRRQETSAAVSFVFSTYNAEAAWDAEPHTPEWAGTAISVKSSARLAFEELESRDPPSAMAGADPCTFIASPLSTWEFVKNIPELVYSCVAVLGRAPQIAVLW